MAKRLLDKKIAIDALISSPAKRARKTAEYFAAEYDQAKNEIIFIDELYLATPAVFASVISQVSDKYKTIAVFSHNNGITDYANTLTNTRIDEMPTCSIFAVKAPVQSWSEFEQAEKEFWFFDYPKATAS